jgi:hypothetical protein
MKYHKNKSHEESDEARVGYLMKYLRVVSIT